MSIENPIAYSVTAAFDWPDNHATSEFIGLFKTFGAAVQAAETTMAERSSEFGEEPDEEWTDGAGKWYEINRNFPDGGIYLSVLPVYGADDNDPSKGDKWTKAFPGLGQ